MIFISSQKLSLFLRYLSFFPDIFGHVEQLNEKVKVNLKIFKLQPG